MKCYSWSRYWSNGEMYHVFERPKHCGYTCDLNKAGVFTDKAKEVLLTPTDVSRAKKEQGNKCYYIPVESIHLLGKTQKTVLN